MGHQLYRSNIVPLPPHSFDGSDRRWFEKVTDELNSISHLVYDVRDFGAYGLNEDYTDAIKRAINEVGATGGIIRFSRGSYIFSDTLIIDNAQPVRIEGVGSATAFINEGPNHNIRLRNSAHEVCNVRFFAPSTATDGRAVIVESTATGAKIYHCTFEQTAASGIWLGTGAAEVIIRENTFDSCGYGSNVVSPFFSHLRGADNVDCQIVNNVFSNGTSKAIDLGRDTAGCDGLYIAGNHISNFSNIGIGVSDAVDTRIIGNYIRDCDDNGIDLNALGSINHVGSVVDGNTVITCKDGVFFGHGATQGTIVSNVIRNCERGVRLLDGCSHVVAANNAIDGTTTAAGVEVNGVGGSNRRPTYITIAHNTIKGADQQGISIRSCDHVCIHDNIVRSADEEGVAGFDADEVQIHDNLFIDVASAVSSDGISLDANSARFSIKNNRFVGSGLLWVIDVGGSNGVVDLNVWSADGDSGGVNASAGDTTEILNRLRGEGPSIFVGTGTPEGNTSATTGSLYLREDGGGSDEIHYSKVTGTGNTGWYVHTESGLSSLA